MIPQLETSGRAAGAISQVPPSSFRPLRGRVSEVDIRPCDYVRQHGRTTSQEIGRRYEAQVQEYLQGRFASYLPEPTVNFLDDGRFRSVRPDGILPLHDHVVIFEIKYTHVPEAWWQLEKLYKVVLDRLYHRPISLVEICRSFDPATPFPVPVTLFSTLDDWCCVHRSTFGVHVWRKTL